MTVNFRRFDINPLRGGVVLGICLLVLLGHYQYGHHREITLSPEHQNRSILEQTHFNNSATEIEDQDGGVNQAELTLDAVDTISATSIESGFPTFEDTITRKEQREILSRAYENERVRLLEDTNFNPIKVASDTGAGQVFEPSLEPYISRLRSFVDEFFDGVESRVHLDRMLDNLEQHIPPPLYPDEPMRKVVISTAKGGLAGIDPELFPAWEEKLGPVGWTVEVADDEMTEYWFENLTKGDGRGTDKWREVWDGLSSPVLKSDLIRVLATLIWGGLYSDSDTRPRSHPYLWGNGAMPLTPPSLRPLINLLNAVPSPLLDSPSSIPPSIHPNASLPSYADSYEGINMPDIGLVTSIEYDGLVRGYEPNGIFAREMQVIQSTIMISKTIPPDPARCLGKDRSESKGGDEESKSRSSQEPIQTLRNDKTIFNMPGPGPFSDAVWQYLLIQYGFSPLSMKDAGNDVARIGDILILPRFGFAQPLPQAHEWDITSPHPEKRAVCHSMMGRWRNKP